MATNSATTSLSKEASLALEAEATLDPVAADFTATLLSAANSLRPVAAATNILDNGSGPGRVTKALLRQYSGQLSDKCTITCADIDPAALEAINSVKEAGGKDWNRVSTLWQDAADSKDIPSGSQSHVLANLVYQLTPSPTKCLEESWRMLEEGGVLALTSWKEERWMGVLGVIGQVTEGFALPEWLEEWKSGEGVISLLQATGFKDCGAQLVDCEWRFSDPSEVADLFLDKLPHVRAMLGDVGEERIEEMKRLMAKETLRITEADGTPGSLRGTAVVGWGRK